MREPSDKEEEARLAAEFLEEWNGDDFAEEFGQVSPGWQYVRFEADEIAISQLERTAEFWRRGYEDSSYWIDVVRSSHLSLTAAMVTALEGSAGVGAMRPRDARKVLEYLEARGVGIDPPPERTMPFLELLDAIQDQDRLHFGPALSLTEEPKRRARELDRIRGLVEHPKFTRWSIPAEDIRAVASLPKELFGPLMDAVPQRYDRERRERVALALTVIGT